MWLLIKDMNTLEIKDAVWIQWLALNLTIMQFEKQLQKNVSIPLVNYNKSSHIKEAETFAFCFVLNVNFSFEKIMNFTGGYHLSGPSKNI